MALNRERCENSAMVIMMLNIDMHMNLHLTSSLKSTKLPGLYENGVNFPIAITHLILRLSIPWNNTHAKFG